MLFLLENALQRSCGREPCAVLRIKVEWESMGSQGHVMEESDHFLFNNIALISSSPFFLFIFNFPSSLLPVRILGQEESKGALKAAF